MIQWFKTMVMNEYIRGVKFNKFPPFKKSIWQRNYYEHVVRNESDFDSIQEYILYNPYNWKNDELWNQN
jgi:putative transposase